MRERDRENGEKLRDRISFGSIGICEVAPAPQSKANLRRAREVGRLGKSRAGADGDGWGMGDSRKSLPELGELDHVVNFVHDMPSVSKDRGRTALGNDLVGNRLEVLGCRGLMCLWLQRDAP